MRFVQEGRIALGCNNSFGKSMDQFFVSSNILVEEARREVVKMEMSLRKISNSATHSRKISHSVRNSQLQQPAGVTLLPIRTDTY